MLLRKYKYSLLSTPESLFPARQGSLMHFVLSSSLLKSPYIPDLSCQCSICLSSINDVATTVIFKALSSFKLTHTYVILSQVLKTFPKNFLNQGFKLPNRATKLSIRALYFNQGGEKSLIKAQTILNILLY